MAHRSKATDRLNLSQSSIAAPYSSGAAASLHQGIVGEIGSPVARRAAQSSCTILITGETGVGKGYLARWIHQNSGRSGGPFIPVNCGAIPDSLVDSQLFGHMRGSFSGATHDHLGLIRAAEQGTLLLDEISELPPSAQNRLLRLLQDREVQPVGLSRPIIVDVRVIAATNIDLKRAVLERRFREDLLFRLDVIRLHVQPLRERLRELPYLLESFNAELARLYGQSELEFDPAAIEVLHRYPWPGNIRQVRSLIERLHVLCPGELITPSHLVAIGHLHPSHDAGEGEGMIVVERLKQERLRRILDEAGGSVARAARMFGVHRSTIYRWLRGS